MGGRRLRLAVLLFEPAHAAALLDRLLAAGSQASRGRLMSPLPQTTHRIHRRRLPGEPRPAAASWQARPPHWLTHRGRMGEELG